MSAEPHAMRTRLPSCGSSDLMVDATVDTIEKVAVDVARKLAGQPDGDVEVTVRTRRRSTDFTGSEPLGLSEHRGVAWSGWPLTCSDLELCDEGCHQSAGSRFVTGVRRRLTYGSLKIACPPTRRQRTAG